jgi:hypothetical protein
MKKNLHLKSLLLIAALVSLTAVTACAAAKTDGETAETPPAGARTGAASATDASDGLDAGPPKVSAEDTETAWDAGAATKISLDSASISVDGAGARLDGNVVTIHEAGTYAVSGTLTDGQIAIAATKDDTVRLVLNGADISNKSGAAIYASQCDKLIVTLVPGTANVVTDGGSGYVYADEAEQEPNAAFFCKDDLTINGTGSLTVNAGFNNGIGTKDDLIVAGGEFFVTAADQGLRGNDSVTVLDGDFTIDAEGDAVHSGGDMNVASGTFGIKSGDDAFHADAALQITGGTIDVSECREGIEGLSVTISGGDIAVVAKDDAVNAAGGATGGSAPGGPEEADRFSSDGERFVRVSGGTLDLSASYDGIDSNGDIFLEGGTVKISGPSQGMDGAIDLDGRLLVTGGELIAAGSVPRPSADSTQAVLLVSHAARQPVGGKIEVRDASGKTLLEYTAKTDYSASAFSSPLFKIGETLSLFVDGEKKTDVKLSDTVTGTADDGGAYGGAYGGVPGNRGGPMPQGGDPGQMPRGDAMPQGGGQGQRPGGGFPAFEGMDEETLRAATEIMREAQGGELSDEQKAALRELGLTDEQISQMRGMGGGRAASPGGGPGPGTQPTEPPTGQGDGG